MSSEEYKFPSFNNDEYIEEYSGNPNEVFNNEKQLIMI